MYWNQVFINVWLLNCMRHYFIHLLLNSLLVDSIFIDFWCMNDTMNKNMRYVWKILLLCVLCHMLLYLFIYLLLLIKLSLRVFEIRRCCVGIVIKSANILIYLLLLYYFIYWIVGSVKNNTHNLTNIYLITFRIIWINSLNVERFT